jgi:hypothetical protein
MFLIVILRSGAAATKNLAFRPAYSEILRFAQNDKEVAKQMRISP